MRRYRPLAFDFDLRANGFQPIQEQWEERVKELHRQSQQQMREQLIAEYGEQSADMKFANFIDLGPRWLTVLSRHNKFFKQSRDAFVIGAYYPALTSACALGERILNYLILELRDEFKGSPEYKHIYRKVAFSGWEIPINCLASWGVLLPAVVDEFWKLRDRRNDAIHFRPDVDHNDRELALAALHNLGAILKTQFGLFNGQKWFITDIAGENYIKKEWEYDPFIRHVYLPNCAYVGPGHTLTFATDSWRVHDNTGYEVRDVTDDEFCELRMSARQ
jgi:hypothetical protein